jgi:hypothetical protein
MGIIVIVWRWLGGKLGLSSFKTLHFQRNNKRKVFFSLTTLILKLKAEKALDFSWRRKGKSKGRGLRVPGDFLLTLYLGLGPSLAAEKESQ